MKILWFTNTPCGSSEKLSLSHQGGGWLKSLEQKLVMQTNIELYVCFYWGEKLVPFSFNNTIYYPVFRSESGSRIRRIVKRFLHQNNDAKEVQELLQIIEEINPDVIHVHGTEDNFGMIQNYTKLPVIISVQGILTSYCEKYFSGIPFFTAFLNESVKSKLLMRSVYHQYTDMISRATRERKILFQAAYIIGRTAWDHQITRILSPNSHYFVGNELLRPLFFENRWGKNSFSEEIQIVTIMSSGLYKGLETVVNSSRILKESGLINFRWTVVGQNEIDEQSRILKRWLKVDFNAINIYLVGKKDEIEVASILANSDIYCQVSHIENSPNSLCEAMLIGMPIIASFAGGTNSILENGKEGVLIQDGDPFSLAGAILDLSKNFDKAVEFARHARRTALKRHDPDQVVKQQIAIYDTVIQAAVCKK
jgi:glycosyltransferase involved in cell wall biosynthesis